MVYIEKLDRAREYNQYKDEQKNTWQYMSAKEYSKLPGDQKRICADMKKKDSKSADRLLKGNDATIGLYEYKPNVSWNKKVVGYIPVAMEEDESFLCCVRILDNSYLKMVLYPLFLLLLLLTFAVGVVLYSQKSDVPGLDQTAVAYHIDGMSNSDPSKIMMPVISRMQLYKGETHIQNMFINPEGNDCYFKFQIILDDTNEVIYESGLVPPGKAIIDFDLNHTLDVGEHNVTVKILAKDLQDENKSLNGGDMKTIIDVVE